MPAEARRQKSRGWTEGSGHCISPPVPVSVVRGINVAGSVPSLNPVADSPDAVPPQGHMYPVFEVRVDSRTRVVWVGAERFLLLGGEPVAVPSSVAMAAVMECFACQKSPRPSPSRSTGGAMAGDTHGNAATRSGMIKRLVGRKGFGLILTVEILLA